MVAEQELEKFRAVNKANSLEELATVIEEKIADPKGRVWLRSGDAVEVSIMSRGCRHFDPTNYPNVLTRRYGIRQQAYMLHAQGKIKKNVK